MRTPGMEDHLEQIYLLTRVKGFTRVSDIAQALSVHDSSATKMAQKLGKRDMCGMRNMEESA